MISIRRAGPADTGAISEIAEEAGLFPSDALADMIGPYFDGAEDHLWSVAVEGDDVTGFVYCAAERFTEGTFNMLAIAAVAGHQGGGIGSQLVTAIEGDLIAVEARLLLVETSSQPQFATAQRFYRSAGFEHVATIPAYWAPGDDKLVFAKPLGCQVEGGSQKDQPLA